MTEILDHAPPELGASECLLLLALAEKADDASRRVLWRRGESPQETLQRRTRLSERGLRAAFQRLAARGLEVRVQRGVDARGRPVFAHEGAAVEYQLPQWRHSDAATDQEAALSCHSGGTLVPAVQPQVAASECRPSPSVPLESLDAGAGARGAGGLPPAQAEAAASLLTRLTPAITSEQARACVAAVVAKVKPDDVGRYVGRFSAEDVVRWAQRGSTGGKPGPARRRCTNGHLIASDGDCCPEHDAARPDYMEASR